MLDAKYILAPSPQCYFVDKVDGFPLANGTIEAFSDNARSVRKNLFALSGTPGSYIYVALPNPCPLTAVGTFSDGFGNDIIPYYYPYDEDGNVELYYLVVKDHLGVEQITRQAWPNFFIADQTNNSQIVNYVPNGQFETHINVPVNTGITAGTISQPITTIAPGGWTFERPMGSSAVDIVTFERFGSDVFTPSSSPRYAVRVRNTSIGGGDGFKDIRIKFKDVNKFSSADDAPQLYTFGITGQTNSGSSVVAQLILLKNFGAGGSIEQQRTLATFTFGNSWTVQYFPFNFENNGAFTIGDDDDDYLQLILRLPLNSIFDASFTDSILTFGNVVISSFPITTDADFQTRTMAGWLPPMAKDGSDLYLPIRSTPSGLEYDRSDVGKVFGGLYFLPKVGEWLCNGTKRITADYSTDNIPHRRLFDVLFDPFESIPITGTGLDYLSGQLTTSSIELRENCNTEGTTTSASDGSTPTGFTITDIHKKTTLLSYAMSCYYNSSGYPPNVGPLLTVVNTNPGGGADIADVNAGITNLVIRRLGYSTAVSGQYVTQIESFTPPSVISTLGGKYFNITTFTPTGGSLLWYVWFKVNGAGTDPAPGGGRVGILVSVNSTDTQVIVGQKIAAALNGFQETSIKTVAGASITAGSYFNIYSTDGTTEFHYAPWYKVDGVGTVPTVGGATLIQVDISAADTAAQVASKTQIAMNSYSYALPDLRGLFPRGWNNSSTNDPESSLRYSLVPGIQGDRPGTFQADDIYAHAHKTGDGASNSGASQGGAIAHSVFTDYTGFYESRPKNFSINWVIKY